MTLRRVARNTGTLGEVSWIDGRGLEGICREVEEGMSWWEGWVICLSVATLPGSGDMATAKCCVGRLSSEMTGAMSAVAPG